jgi:hypothetical protein
MTYEQRLKNIRTLRSELHEQLTTLDASSAPTDVVLSELEAIKHSLSELERKESLIRWALSRVKQFSEGKNIHPLDPSTLAARQDGEPLSFG